MTNARQDLISSTIIGKEIKYLRRKKKITQQMLAALIGVTFQQLQKYENGKNRMSIDILIKICYFLKIKFSINKNIIRIENYIFIFKVDQ